LQRGSFGRIAHIPFDIFTFVMIKPRMTSLSHFLTFTLITRAKNKTMGRRGIRGGYKISDDLRWRGAECRHAACYAGPGTAFEIESKQNKPADAGSHQSKGGVESGARCDGVRFNDKAIIPGIPLVIRRSIIIISENLVRV
jgi:hypothetical protein